MSEETPGDAKVAALRSEIEQTRAELGETVELLAQKADVKARAKEKVDETKARAAAAAAEAKEKARVKAQHVAESSRELAQELRTDPAVPARRAMVQVRTSVREKPKQWAAVAAALVAFAALVVRKRRRRAARRIRPEALRPDWRKQWEAGK
jgi:ElaB/YqjD/DUF883 family membrane-anchored ribosome-binding protein